MIQRAKHKCRVSVQTYLTPFSLHLCFLFFNSRESSQVVVIGGREGEKVKTKYTSRKKDMKIGMGCVSSWVEESTLETLHYTWEIVQKSTEQFFFFLPSPQPYSKNSHYCCSFFLHNLALINIHSGYLICFE